MLRSPGLHRLVLPSNGRFRDARADDPAIGYRRIVAWFHGRPTNALIFHSDCGTQYASGDFRKQVRLCSKWFEDDENYDRGHESRRSLINDPEKTRVMPVCLFRQILPDFCEIP